MSYPYTLCAWRLGLVTLCRPAATLGHPEQAWDQISGRAVLIERLRPRVEEMDGGHVRGGEEESLVWTAESQDVHHIVITRFPAGLLGYAWGRLKIANAGRERTVAQVSGGFMGRSAMERLGTVRGREALAVQKNRSLADCGWNLMVSSLEQDVFRKPSGRYNR
ncbi:hypothetical protein LY76DRAFT_609852 [Colletotrichum caudatum]|nr:hypothetical protein LY76DRAFT_609852 [Colletotrichum caudatum]